MPSNWNVRRREPSVVELTETLTALRTEAIEALKHGGEYGRPYREAMANIASVERRLEAAKEKQERRKRDDAGYSPVGSEGFAYPHPTSRLGVAGAVMR